ncbi:hypothetical protein AB0H76_06205 [Nocardia sp. NPDC050712]|uniref:hypothetical protein n=1 Tax=Nocardia sp. NPDC050712 TaxID=3155518 RepID=UPI00340441AB
MATVGISIEQTVVRGVVLQGEPPQIVVRATQRRLPGDTAGAVITGVLEGFAAEFGAGDRIEDVAIVYRSVSERRSILTELATGRWATASLVSDRTALAALTRAETGFQAFGTVLVLEVLEGYASYVCLGPDRGTVSAADSWAFGSAEADTASQILPILNADATPPDAVVLCGSATGDPDLLPALRRGLAETVTLVPYHVDAAARGAALVAADQVRQLTPAPPPVADNRRARRLLAAAVAVTVLGTGAALATAAIRDNSPAGGDRTLATAPPSTSSLTPSPTEAASPLAPPASTEPPLAPPPPAEPSTAQPPAEPWPTTPNAPRRPSTPGTPEPAESTEPSPAPPAQTPPRTAVGAPDANGLFPGESPPPPSNADPAAIRAWWANHWQLKERWLNGG